MATIKRTCLAGNKNKSDTFTLYHTCRPNPLNHGIHPIHHKRKHKKLYTIASNLSNIAQLKARNLHKIIQVELTWERRIRLHENEKAIKEIIFGEII